MKQLIIGITLFFVTISQSFGQKYGEDSVQCLQNLSTMHEFVKINVYDYALTSWLYVFDNCPAASKNTYIYGSRIIKYLIQKADDERKSGLIDTLMLMYDRRIEYFGQKGYVQGKKGIDLMKYDKSRIEEAYGYLKESVELSQSKTEPAVALTFIMVSVNLSKMGKISCEEVVNNYVETDRILSERLVRKANDKKTKGVKSSVENFFTKSECSSCENLIGLYEPKFDSNQDNIEFLSKTTAILVKKDCDDSPFFAKASERLYSLEPSADAAYNLAKLFNTKGEYKKSSDYFMKAINLEENSEKKASYLYQLSLIEMNEFKNYNKARDYALRAAKLKANWGDPYILIGRLYVGSVKQFGTSEFEKDAVFWAAVDKFKKAKSVDPDISQKAEELINQYSAYYPSKEEIFFQGYEEGQVYEVKGWINEKTKVRSN